MASAITRLLFSGVISLAVALPAADLLNHAPKGACLDLENRDPGPIEYGFPEWRTTDNNPNCKPILEANRKGECIKHINSGNDCKAYCERSWGWYYGLPEDISIFGFQNWCQRTDGCALSINTGVTPGEIEVISESLDRTGQTNRQEIKSHVWKNTWSMTRGWDVNLGYSQSWDMVEAAKMAAKLAGAVATGGTSLAIAEGAEAAAKVATEAAAASRGQKAADAIKDTGLGAKFTASFGYRLSRSNTKEKSKSLTYSWTDSVNDAQKWGVTRTRTNAMSVGISGTFGKPGWAADFCGQWHSVPLIGVSCGRAAMGELVKTPRNTTKCEIDMEWGAFDTCVSYLFQQPNILEATRAKMAFVLKDCEHGWILPGEFQDPAYAASISSFSELEIDLLDRYGSKNLPSTKRKPRDAGWVELRRGLSSLNFTKEIGPEDYNFKYCSRGQYCVRHKLSDGNCYDIPRGYNSADGKSVDMVSAEVTPGTCCVIFSRHQCQGQPQLLKGSVNDFDAAGYVGLGHSVVCNVAEYCDPYLRETPDYEGTHPIFIKDPRPWIQQ